MRVLVTAATKYGATAQIAQAIAEVLDEHGLEATVLPPEQVKGVDGYDAVVVGSAVYAGHCLKPARELVERHAGVGVGLGGPRALVLGFQSASEASVEGEEVPSRQRTTHGFWLCVRHGSSH